MKQSITLIILIACLCMIPFQAAAGEITLAWDLNEEPNLAGYRLYIQEGAQASGYRLLVDISLADIDIQAPSFSVFDLEADTQYHFAITAYDDYGNESGFSNSVCVLNEDACAATNSDSSSGGCFLDTLNTPCAWKPPARDNIIGP
jgi:hypothetical protein